ncbi:MAG: metallophosphoesterase [Planctomycetes bacterium]|nr:metallophosphoesterase [Planctomycetota bacterium]
MTPLLWSITVLASLVDGLLLAWLLLRKPPSRVGGARLALALVVTGAVFVLKAPVLAFVAHNGFYVVRLAYVDLVIVVPVVAALLLLAGRRRELARGVRLVAWLGLAGAPLGVWATFVEPKRLVEERVEVLVDPAVAPSEPLRIAVLADLQSADVDEHLRRAVRATLAFEPHLILLPGDLIQRRDAPDDIARAFHELVLPLTAPLGAYFVLGNTDHIELVRRALAGTPVRILVNETISLAFGGQTIVIGGAGELPSDPETREFVAEFDQRRGDELRILVSHFPDVLLPLDGEPGVHLTVAGHTHGGQIQLPFVGPLLTLSDVPRAVAGGGLHELHGRPIYVSRGVGCERMCAPTVRFLCPPEVSLLTVRAR